MLDFLTTLDRRWVFLLMALAVGIPVLSQRTFPEAPTAQTRSIFNAVEDLPEGSLVLLAFDYDPASAPELQPMATAFTRHCCLKKHKMVFLTLWPTGPPMIDDTIRSVIQGEFADAGLTYGEDYVNLGYRPGREVVVKSITADLRKLYGSDVNGTNLDDIPVTRDLKNILEMKLALNISAGYPGAKEWVQYGTTQGTLPLGVGVTGVQAPQMYPYYPDQVLGILAALKGAAEYEAALGDKYERYRDPAHNEAIKRMGPQLFAHLLMVGLIVLGNVVHFANRRRRAAR